MKICARIETAKAILSSPGHEVLTEPIRAQKPISNAYNDKNEMNYNNEQKGIPSYFSNTHKQTKYRKNTLCTIVTSLVSEIKLFF